MNKLSLKSTWLLLLIPIGIVFFVVVPQIQNTYNDFHKRELEHLANVQKLDSLNRIENPTRTDLNKIKTLSVLVTVHGKVIENERYNNYKIGGMLVALAIMFLGMFGSSYWVRHKKSSPNNKQVTFNYADPSFDTIGEQVSWEAEGSGGSNFLSEHLKKTRAGYKIASSSYMKFVSWSFFLVGVNQLFWTYFQYFKNTEALSFMKIGSLFFTSGGIFMIIGVFFVLLTGAKAVIHTRKRKLIVDNKILDFHQLHALQVLEKLVHGSSSSGSYMCYEVNVVTKQGERHNLLNHGDKVFILSDMAKLSKILSLPVWNRGVV